MTNRGLVEPAGKCSRNGVRLLLDLLRHERIVVIDAHDIVLPRRHVVTRGRRRPW
jgi:hypothetical protein